MLYYYVLSQQMRNVTEEYSAKYSLKNIDITLNLEEIYNEKTCILSYCQFKNGGICLGGIRLGQS